MMDAQGAVKLESLDAKGAVVQLLPAPAKVSTEKK